MYAPDPRKVQICNVGKRMYEKNLVVANDGNISWRVGDNEIFITPSRVCKADMTPDMILTVDANGTLVAGQGVVSTELKMHLAAYRGDPDIQAVVHAHPFHATAFAVAGIPLDRLIYPTGFSFLGKVPVAPYGTSTTNELAESVAAMLEEGHRAILLANHGALTCAASLWDAYYLMERLENYAGICFAARQLGGGRELSDDEAERLRGKIRRQKAAGLL
jgi:L-fuculose-phosphate aldolase